MRRAFGLGVLVCLAVSTVVAFVPLRTKRALGILPKVYAHEGCSLKTLNGSYGFGAHGLVNPTEQPFVSTSATIPIAVISAQAFDGAGNFSSSNTSNVGGLRLGFPQKRLSEISRSTPCVRNQALTIG
jgi:hypothetical protein